MKKALTLLLSAVMLLPLVSCTESSDSSPATDAAPAETAEADTAETEAPDYLDTLGEIDLGGENIRLAGWQNLPRRNFPDDAEDGEPVNDALYKRNMEIAERYNVTFSYYTFPETADLLKGVDNSIMAASDDYDAVIANMNPVAASLVQKNEITSFDNVPYVDLTQPWWSKYNDTLTLGGKQYFPSGIITPLHYNALYVMLFNKRVAESYGLNDIYPTVIGLGWTVDKMAEMMSGVTSDINGDGKLNNEDQWALVYDDVAGFGFYIGAGQKMTKIDENGSPYLDMDNEESVSVITRLAAAIGDRSTALRGEDYYKNCEGDIFFDGRALFAGQTFTWIPVRYREMEDDYGVLPMPMLDESQGKYLSYSQPWTGSGVCVPVTNTKLDKTGLILEALAYLSNEYIRVAAYETTFKTKLSRDSESAVVLDLVADASTYDLDVIFNWGGSADILRDSVLGKKSDFVSAYAKVADKADQAIANLLEQLGD